MLELFTDGDLFGAHQTDIFEALAEIPPTTTAYLAVTHDGGSNVYINGFSCTDCDQPRTDPYLRKAVPCRNAERHARYTVSSWNFHGKFTGRTDARVIVVTIPDTGDHHTMIAAARAAMAETGPAANNDRYGDEPGMVDLFGAGQLSLAGI